MNTTEFNEHLSELKRRIRDFGSATQGKSVSAGYADEENVSIPETKHVNRYYLPLVLRSPFATKCDILQSLSKTWDDVEERVRTGEIVTDAQRKHWMKWGRAVIGIGFHLLLPQDVASFHPVFAPDVVVKVSRWFWTDNGLWAIGNGPTKLIVESVWGHIEKFRDEDGNRIWKLPGDPPRGPREVE